VIPEQKTSSIDVSMLDNHCNNLKNQHKSEYSLIQELLKIRIERNGIML